MALPSSFIPEAPASFIPEETNKETELEVPSSFAPEVSAGMPGTDGLVMPQLDDSLLPVFDPSYRPETPAERQGIGRFGQAFIGGLAAIPEAASVIAEKPAAFMESIFPLEGGVPRNARENLLYQAGQQLRSEAESVFPIDPNRPKSFLADTLPSGAGSMASFITGGVALKGSKLLTTPGQIAGGVAALGAATGGAEAYREAIEKGADDDTAFKVFAANAALGTTEAVPIAGWLNRLNKASGNKLKQAIIEGSEEAVQEVFQQFGGNLVASKTFDPDRKLMGGTGEGAAAGFTLGSLMSLVVSAIGGRQRGANIPLSEPSATIDEEAINRGLEERKTPYAVQQETTSAVRDVQQPEVTPESAEQVPTEIRSEETTEALAPEVTPTPPVQDTPAKTDRVADEDLSVVVQSPGKLGDTDTPGYVQVDSIRGGKNEWSSNPNTLNSAGYKLPTTKMFLSMPQGKYTMPQALQMLKEKALNELVTAVKLKGKVFTDPDKGHIKIALDSGIEDAIQEVSKPENQGFVYNGDFISREDASTLLGETLPLQSERLRELRAQRKKGGETIEKAKEKKVLTETPTAPVAEPVPMGAATASEFTPPVPFVTSNKNAIVDQERAQRGLPPMMSQMRQSNQAAWDEAMREIDQNPQRQDELIAELTNNPRALTATENALLLHRRVDLRNEYEKALKRWKQAFDDNDLLLASEESQRVKEWNAALADLEDVTKRTGRASGQSLQARKMMANEDFSLAAMELRAMEAKGRELTNEEHIELIKAQQKITELQNRLFELEGAKEAKDVEASTTETMKEVSSEAPNEAKSKDFDLDREGNLLSGIKAKVDKGQTNDITSLVQQLARVFWRRGVRGREPMIDELHGALKTIIPEFTRDDTKRAFSGYGNFKPLSKEEIDVGLRDLRGQTQQVLKMEAIEARKPLEKTGQERRVPSDEERRLIKQVNELKRKYGVVVTDPATQLKSALAARKTYYEHRIADLRHEIETRQRIVKSKSASPSDPELQALIAEHERLKEEHAQIFTKPDMTDEQRLKMAIAAAQRNQAHWEVRLENAEKGVFDKRTPGRKVTSAELELIQAETAAIREHVKELESLSKPKKSKEEIALQSLKTRMNTRIAEFKRRVKDKDFAKKVKEPTKLDAEATKIKAELDLAKEEFETKREQDRWARMSVFQKTKRKIADVYDAARALMTTGEFSFILRQGKLAALSHPLKTAKALPDMFRALLSSEQRAREIDMQTHNDPDADAARAAKLYLVEEGVSLHKQEEILMGRWVGKIPVVKNFNRAAQVFLNRIRLDMWKSMRKSMSKSGTPTPEEDRQIAMFVNEATGRGGLGKLEPAAVPLARGMFSPRYYASRLQLAAGHSLWGGTMRTRRIIATEYARALVGLGLYYTALSMFFSSDDDEEKGKIEVDPRSTDFGKVKVGNTRLDPLAGLSQVIVLGSRSATGEKKTLAGEVQPIRGKEVPYGGDKWSDIVARHLRGKLHPVPASIANLFDGTDLGGDEATVVNQAGNLVAPITYIDIWTALKEQGLDDGAALALLALLGEGIQTYKEKED